MYCHVQKTYKTVLLWSSTLAPAECFAAQDKSQNFTFPHLNNRKGGWTVGVESGGRMTKGLGRDCETKGGN